MRQWQKFVLFALVFAGIPLLMAQTGPTVFTPRLTVSPGPLTVTTGATTVQDLTINGTCTGCTTTSPGGSNTQVQYNNSGAFGGDAGLTYNAATDALTVVGALTAGTVSAAGSNTQVLYNASNIIAGDAGMTYVAGTDTLSVGTVTAATAVTVAGQNVCRANATNCPGVQNGLNIAGGLYGIRINNSASTTAFTGFTGTVNCTFVTTGTLGGSSGSGEGGIQGVRINNGGNCTGTSNAATMTIANWPTSFTGTLCGNLPVIDNGATVQGNVCVDTSGNATFGVGLVGGGGFTASGTKGLPDNISVTFVNAGG